MSGTNLTRALVTGASSGIGEAFCRRLAGPRARLTLVGRDREKLDALAKELDGEHTVLVADLATVEGVRVVESSVSGQDLVVLNAGVHVPGQVVEQDSETLEHTMQLMATGVFAVARAAAEDMKDRDAGSILTVASRAAFVPEPGLAVYCAAKAAVRSFTLALARELEDTRVRVHLCCPGATRTPMHARAGVQVTAEQQARRVEPDVVAREALLALQAGERVSVPGEPGWHTLLARVFGGRALAKVAGVLTRLARR